MDKRATGSTRKRQPRLEYLCEPSGGRNRWQPVENRTPRKPLKQADPQPVATHGNGSAGHGKQGVCRGLPSVAGGPFPGKEGVSSSSPEEGSAKAPLVGAFS